MRIFTVIAALIVGLTTYAQTTLFTYPVAPDTCTTLESRCNYLVQHFWDNCELAKPIDNSKDSLLLEAMAAYLDVMRAGANVNLSITSIRDLMFKAQANQANYVKLMRAAEFLLYMRPTTLIDDIYLAFAQSASNASWAKKDFKDYYKQQVTRINNTKLGSNIVDMDITLTDGTKTRLRSLLTAEVNLIFITDNGSTDSNFERTRLFTDLTVKQAIADGSLKVINIVAGDTPKPWDAKSLEYSSAWTVGASKGPMSLLDIRIMPCIIILDKDGNVQLKNLTVDALKKLFQ